ncbi:unnamed protein product [Acidithrix sp. C25]|nr:unnamed protein product [Acidithrix sp. C25]
MALVWDIHSPRLGPSLFFRLSPWFPEMTLGISKLNPFDLALFYGLLAYLLVI